MNYLIGAYCKVLALKVMHRRHKHSDCNAKMKGRGYKAIDTSLSAIMQGEVWQNSSRAMTYLDVGWTCGGVAHSQKQV